MIHRADAPVLLCLSVALLIAGSPLAKAQTGAPPSQPAPTVAPSTGAPREPVHKAHSAAPVVAPNGSQPRHKVTQPAQVASPPKQAVPAAGVPNGTPAVSSEAAAPGATSPAKPGGTPTVKQGEKPREPETVEGGAAKLPRFASLRSDDVNMRVGPGIRYRIDWVYKRRDLPMKIERQYDVWRWVVDPDGIHGWVHQATLMGRRTFVVQHADATLRSDPSDTAAAVAVLEPGVIGRIRSCEAKSDWCNVQTGSYRGYLRRQQFWGVLPGEAVEP